jgi:hypothetical protein
MLNYPPVGGPLNNYGAAAAPTATDDAAHGYSVGSRWLYKGIAYTCIDATATAAIWASPPGSTPYLAGQIYPMHNGVSAATAVATLETVLYLTPFMVRAIITPSAIAFRCTTGANNAGALAKIGEWKALTTDSSRPTGLPITGLVSNTGVSTGTTAAAVTTSIATSGTLYPGLMYFFGVAFTVAAPSTYAIANNQTPINWLVGRPTVASTTITGYTAPFAYADDITGASGNLTLAAMTVITSDGGNVIPLFTAG